ncbi:unnamed protein product [Polarella glacialis]|uniref:Uncharacterized protein n=1 Tax=Polarella glacialis TaxID=89957 RepID=A0A813L0P4_POLGL|nr:unnamed protein product [Polarella glacialis]
MLLLFFFFKSRYYWAKPWMLKTHFLETVSNVRKGIQSVPKEATEDLAGWDLETLVLLPAADASRPQVLLGDPLNLPEYEAMCLRRDHDTKDEKSRSRLRIVLGIASVLGLFAGCRRLIKSMSVSQSYGFVRRAVLADTDVQFVLGPTANIQSSNGTFTARYINARLRLVSDSGTVADVDVAATRDDGGIRPWRVALARMRVGGSIYKLGLQNEYR